MIFLYQYFISKETHGLLMNEASVCSVWIYYFIPAAQPGFKMEINKVFFPGLSSSPLGGGSFTSSNTKCPVCSGAFVQPKVLPCFHTFCQPCLERCQVSRLGSSWIVNTAIIILIRHWIILHWYNLSITVEHFIIYKGFGVYSNNTKLKCLSCKL